jgi:CRISPR-associated protein Cas5t
MRTIWLRARAPFAAFRWMQAGVWRATSPVIPPSAAWGLVLNLAGIETRVDPSAITTQVNHSAPPLQLAVGEARQAGRAVLYQQLHAYPVGSSGAELAKRSHGAKYWIAPVRREILIDFDVVIGVRSRDELLLDNVLAGLRGELSHRRYGLPFAGDNNFLFDQIDIMQEPPPARWYTRVASGERARKGSCRLTVAIDRSDSSQTKTLVFAPIESPTIEPPSSSWIWTPLEPAVDTAADE